MTTDTRLKNQLVKTLTQVFAGHKEYQPVLETIKKVEIPNVEVACLYLYLFLDPKLFTPENKRHLDAFEEAVFSVKPANKMRK